MKILILNGDPKPNGFIPGTLDVLAEYLAGKGAEVERVALAAQRVKDCIGCFQCLKTGECCQDDDVDAVIQNMLDADGIVIGSPVRNGATTGLYKRFYERITYRIGFPLLLESKHVLAVSSVGLADGKSVNRKFLGLQNMGARLSTYLFFRVGIPSKVTPEDVRPRLERAADTLLRNIETRRPRRLPERLAAAFDRLVVGRIMLKRSPETYAHVIECWKKKGYM